jgi:hypothetical protein
LRNEIAHGRESKKRTSLLDALRRTLLEGGTEKFREKVKDADDKETVVYAAARGSGFIAILVEQLEKGRGLIDQAHE